MKRIKADGQGSKRGGVAARRAGSFILLNLMFAIAVAIMALVGPNADPRVVYLIALFCICSSPVLVGEVLHSRFALLAVILPLLLLFYGASDLFELVSQPHPQQRVSKNGLLSVAEVAVLIGVGALALGYASAVRGRRRAHAKLGGKEWPLRSIVSIALPLWMVGTVATLVWQLDVADRSVQASIGQLEALLMVVARTAQPLGVGLLVYAYLTSRNRRLLWIVLGVFAVEFVIGFVGDSKELALRGPAILIAGKCLIDGRLPKGWMLAVGLVFGMSFAIFQAYRFEVLQTAGKSRSEAARQLQENLDKAMSSSLLEEGYLASGLKRFTERTALKPTIELVTSRVGRDVEYQDGKTLALLATGFVPRFIWPGKPDSSVGQLFNREFGVSADPDTYISSTHLGELYWNFGWVGVIAGMFVIGAVLGVVGGAFALSESRSVTRFLVLVTTIYYLGLRFEGSIALQYTVWIRSLLMLGLLHFAVITFTGGSSRGSGCSRPGKNFSAGRAVPRSTRYGHLPRRAADF